MAWLHSQELIFMQWLMQFHSPFLDRFFLFWNVFDTTPYYVLVVVILWAGFYWKSGARVFYFFALNDLINSMMKALFAQPRPYEFISSLGLIHVKTFGFPSGGAQNALLLAGMFIYAYRKKKWAWIIGLNYCFWISLARIYLGVHFPSDVLGGWFFGTLVLLTYIYVLPSIEKWICESSTWRLVLISHLIPIAVIALYPIGKSLVINGAFMGVSMGLVLSRRYHLFLPKTENWVEGAIKVLLALSISEILYLGMHLGIQAWPSGKLWIIVLSFYLIGCWFSFGFGYVWKRFLPFFKVR